MGNLKAPFKIWLVIITAGILSSCRQLIPILATEIELTLGGNQNWSIQHYVVLPGDVKILVGQIQESLDQVISNFESKGVNASWGLLQQQPNETNINYRKSISGTNFDSLNQVEFHYSPQLIPFLQGLENKLTLMGSKFFSANQVLMDMEIVQWTDPSSQMTVVESTAKDLTWLWIILLALSGIGFILAGLGVSGKLPKWNKKAPSHTTSRSNEESPASLPVNNKYCPQCGTANPLEAGFCIKCGVQFPSQ